MNELLSSIFGPIKPLLDNFIDNLPALIMVVLGLVLVLFGVIRVTVTYGGRWKRNARFKPMTKEEKKRRRERRAKDNYKEMTKEERREYQDAKESLYRIPSYGGTRELWPPRKWKTIFALQPKQLHKYQEIALKSDALREAKAPAARHIEEKKEKGIYIPDAVFSEFPSAVKKTMTDNHGPRKGKHMYAARQIREASKSIVVRPKPDDVFVGGDQSKHFVVDLYLNGARHSETAKLVDDVGGIFETPYFEKIETELTDRVTVLVHKEKPEDILLERKFGVAFFRENPAKSPYSLPLAVREDGKPWCLSLHHTLIYGMTGAGKGGPIQGAIRQLAPFVHKGTVKLYGIDPKGPELGAYAKKGVHMFERISIGLAEENIRQHVKTINMIAAIIAERGNNIDPDFTEGQENLNRDIPATRETPWIVLFIDEYLTLVKGLKKLGREGAPALATLDQILATGRSFGVYVILATQVATKEVFGDVRDNVPNTVVLKHKASDYWTTEFLGDDIPGTRFDPKKIGPSNKDNGYKTAGIASVSTAEGVIRVRFGYLSDKDIVEIAKQFMDADADLSAFKEKTPVFDPKDYGLEITQEEAEAMDGIFEDDDEGGFAVEKVPTPKGDDFLLALNEFSKSNEGGRQI